MSGQQRESGYKANQLGEVQHFNGGAIQGDPGDEPVQPRECCSLLHVVCGRR